MKIGGLSEKEVKSISKIFEQHHIPFEISKDQDMMDLNSESIQYNLRHLNSPNISTHILSINVEDDHLNGLPDDIKEELLVFGITNEVPAEFTNLQQANTQEAGQELLKGNKRLIGTHFLLEICITAIIIGITYLASKSFF